MVRESAVAAGVFGQFGPSILAPTRLNRTAALARAGTKGHSMPLNDLLAQHQLAQLNGSQASNDEERRHFADLESVYAAKIEAWRAALDLPDDGWPSGASPA